MAGNSIKNVADWNKLTFALYKVNSTNTALVLKKMTVKLHHRLDFHVIFTH